MHDYYSLSADELKKVAKIGLEFYSSSDEVFKAMAREMADAIIQNNKDGKITKFIIPVGPIGQYPFLTEIINKERISLKNCWFFNMDEYLTDDRKYIDKNHFLSFRGYMERNFYSVIDPELVNPASQRFFPDPENPGRVTETLAKLGNADICFGGIGINGHVAFNEARKDLTVKEFSELTTRVLPISSETIAANSIGDLGGAIEDLPKFAATIGMKEILSSEKIRLGVFRPWHRAVIRRACCGQVTAEFPVTLLQNHKDAKIYVNDIAAEKAF